MPLHTQTTGQGPELVMLHGWGLHGGIFDALAAELSNSFRVSCIDLPGHGRSRDEVLAGDLSLWVDAVLAVAPQRVAWLGWSLGGLLAQYIAQNHPARCSHLFLTNTTPKFLTAADWPQAQTPDILDQFATGLRHDYRATVQQFLALQVRSGPTGRSVLRTLRDKVFAHGDPHPDALLAGVEILRNTDLRSKAKMIHQPTQIITGRLDRLTPPAAGEFLQQQIPHAHLYQFSRSAHAPFLSHPDEFTDQVRNFLIA